MINWQPIETAPKDGRRALVYRPLAHLSGDQPIAIRRLMGTDHHCWPCTVPAGAEPKNPTDGVCHVTHWAPINPPEKTSPEPSQDILG